MPYIICARILMQEFAAARSFLVFLKIVSCLYKKWLSDIMPQLGIGRERLILRKPNLAISYILWTHVINRFYWTLDFILQDKWNKSNAIVTPSLKLFYEKVPFDSENGWARDKWTFNSFDYLMESQFPSQNSISPNGITLNRNS